MEKINQGVIIADTSGLISLFSPTDHNHEVAVKAAKRLSHDHKDILIPAAVLVEFLNILGRKAGHAAALAAVTELTPPFLVISSPPTCLTRQRWKSLGACRRGLALPTVW
jgi:predicted nucleic acid-binding protein